MIIMSAEIIIQLVLYRDAAFLPGLVGSLREQSFSDFSVLALDNCGHDDSGQRFKELFPDGELFKSDENLGFAGGHNFLLKHTRKIAPRFVVILNTDVELHKDFLKTLYDQMNRNTDIDACGPVILNGVGTERTPVIQNFRLFMDFSRATKQSPDVGKNIGSDDDLPSVGQVDYLSGVALMLRAEVLDELSLWDENLFLYGEERDFFCRFAQSGRRASVTRHAICWHFHDWTKGNARSYQREYYYLRRNKILFFRKYDFTRGLSRFLLGEILKLPVSFFWTIRKGGLRMFYLYWLGIFHGLMGKTGKMDL